MGFDPDGDRLNQFAVVIYIPEPLSRFLDDLRLELAPDCRPRAHVSVLPPRPIGVPWQQAAEEARLMAGEFAPFEIEAGNLALFPPTQVIYLEIARGAEQLHRMHDALGRGSLSFDEPFPYHPHITVAQELDPDTVTQAYEHAAKRWQAHTGPRTFRAEKAVFVQNTSKNHWIDLAELSLGVVPVR